MEHKIPVYDQMTHPSCVFVNTYYPTFVSSIYQENPGLESAPYEHQKSVLISKAFGDSDFYSEGLKNAGWHAVDIIINILPLQVAWANENEFKPNNGHVYEIAFEQIRRLKPQVIYIQDLGVATADFMASIRPYGQLIVGQIASSVPDHAYLQGFDLIVSSFPHFVDRFQKMNLASFYQPLAFDPRVLDQLPKNAEREFPVTFIGGISQAHSERKIFLETLATHIPIDFWGYGFNILPENSPVCRMFHGEAWGLDMFKLLNRSFITVNAHLNVAENYANNMRLFEATGCGALLVTDYKDNLNDLFEIGKEVVAYRSTEECAALIKYYLKYPDEAREIARAGQARTLKDHTYAHNMQETAQVLSRHLKLKEESKSFPLPDMSRISSGYVKIEQSEITPNMVTAWKDGSIPAKQRSLVQQELEEMYRGHIPAHYKALADILSPIVFPGCSILEIGCASGYYYEILQYLLKTPFNYTGIDYSEPLINMAKQYYPKVSFFVADGANLFFADNQFDIVISGCVLLHVPNYRQHIFETARVAKSHVIASRTPICRIRPTQYQKKYAYEVETVEITFNEAEFIKEFELNRLELLNQVEYFANPQNDHYNVTYLWKKN